MNPEFRNMYSKECPESGSPRCPKTCTIDGLFFNVSPCFLKKGAQVVRYPDNLSLMYYKLLSSCNPSSSVASCGISNVPKIRAKERGCAPSPFGDARKSSILRPSWATDSILGGQNGGRPNGGGCSTSFAVNMGSLRSSWESLSYMQGTTHVPNWNWPM